MYTATFTPTGAVAKTIDVAENTFTDVAANSNPAADQFNWTYIVPVATLTTDKTDFSEHQSSVITATLSAPSVQETVIAFTPSGTAVFDGDYSFDYLGKGAVTTVAGGSGQKEYPNAFAVDVLGNIYVGDATPQFSGANDVIRKWVPGAAEGVTVAGGNGSGSNANQFHSVALSIDALGNLKAFTN